MTDTAHEAYDLLTRLQEAMPAALKEDRDVTDALDALEDALTSYDRACEVTTGDLVEWVREAARSRSNGLAQYLEIPEGSVSMSAMAVDSPANGGQEFFITIGTRQFLLTIAPNNGMG